MATNPFESSRIAGGSLNRGAQTGTGAPNNAASAESAAISRDDERDGFSQSEAGGKSEAGREGKGANEAPRVNRTNACLVLAASTITGDRVRNSMGEDLGTIEEILLDVQAGRIAYAVLSFGGFLGIGDKLFAVPWRALQIDTGEHEFILEIDRKALETAPGFDKHNWPDMADPEFSGPVHTFYKQTPYWEQEFTDAGDYVGDDYARNDTQRNRGAEYEPVAVFRPAAKQ
jgi:sporulation protein YlmC with PRC-barrel domain